MNATRFEGAGGSHAAGLPDWSRDDLASFWPVFHRCAAAILAGHPPLRPAQTASAELKRVFAAATKLPPDLGLEDVRRFLDAQFAPHAVEPRAGLLTGYYEPVVDGSRRRGPEFSAPILPRPADLVTLAQGSRHPDLPAGFAAGRSLPGGGLAPYAERAILETFAVSADATPIVWLRDWTEVFLIQVQGSARVRLDDGSQIRLVYAGRNGHPYTSIGRLLIEAGEIEEAEMSLKRLKAWIRAHGQEPGDKGRQLMQRNSSYVFFRADAALDHGGPTGGAGLPLTPLRSIAVDRSRWSYGLPFWITTAVPVPGFGDQPLGRLFLAEDTGSAIVGPARADLFLGSGDEAGRLAGLVRHQAEFTPLLPRIR